MSARNRNQINNHQRLVRWNYAGRIQIDPLSGCEKIVVVGTAEISGIDYALAARYKLLPAESCF